MKSAKYRNKTLKYYDHNSENSIKFYNSLDMSDLQSILINRFNLEDKILEIGCGSGRDAEILANNGLDIECLDGSEGMINYVSERLPNIKCYHKLIPDGLLDFSPQLYNGIFSIATLMHLNELECKLSINEIYRLLKDDGKVIISVPTHTGETINDLSNYDKFGRWFLWRSINWWKELFESKFETLDFFENYDNIHGKERKWLVYIGKI